MRYADAMPFLHYLMEVFIGTFGITRPPEEKRNQVAVLLGGFLLLVFLLILAIGGFLIYSIRQGR